MTALANLPDPASASSIGWVLLSLAALAVAANAIASFWRQNIRETPSPSATYATKEEHRDLRTRLDEELGRERGSRKRMHEEIAALQADTKSLRSESEAQTNQLGDLKAQLQDTNRRIDEVPRRTLELLNTTKQLHS